MHVRVRFTGFPDSILIVVSKLTRIEEFRKLVAEKFHVEPKTQLLFYGGKLLEDGYTFHDYKIKLNDVIQLMEKTKPSLVESQATTSSETTKETKKETALIQKKTVYKETISKLYKVGDIVDVKDTQLGSWEEGVIKSIVIDETDAKGSNNVTDDSNLLYITKLEHDDTLDELFCKLSEIRPRARKVIQIQDVQVGQIVMINHNIDEPTEVGEWYDFKVEDVKTIRKHHTLFGELLFGPQSVPSKASVKVIDKIFAIEEPVPLSQRSATYNKLIATSPPKRRRVVICKECCDVSDVPCKHCGCYICAGKDSPAKIVLCDECDDGYHIGCLTPPLDAIPDDDWYCPSCKRNPDEVIAPGGSKQTRKTSSNKTRDWGRGMACIGKTKSSDMPIHHFGPIPGIEVGMSWRYRMQLSETGLHRPSVSGIHGRDAVGAFSIVLSGGYEDDEDHGNEFTYTGSGGRDLSGNKRTAKQSSNQKFVRENRALARNCAAAKVSENGGDAGDKWQEGKPVRVMRSCKMLKSSPKYAPLKGIRYDGIYKVVKYYPETGRSGFRVFKYLLRRDDPSPAPWEPKAKKYDIEYPDGYLEAEAQKKALTNKKNSKGKHNNCPALEQIETNNNGEASSSGTKRTLEKDGNDSTPKRRKLAPNDTWNMSPSPTFTINESDGTISNQSSPKNDNKALAGSSKSKAQGKRKQKIIVSKSKKSMKSKQSKSKNSKKNNESKSKKSKKSNESKSKKAKTTKGSKVGAKDSMDSEKSGPRTSKSPAGTKTVKKANTLSASLMKLIESDQLNSHLWKELLDICKRDSVTKFIENVAQTFRCVVCQHFVTSPVTTPCRHNFCLVCIKRAFKSLESKTCPCCRQSLADFEIQINENFQNALRIILPGYDAY